MKLLLVALAAAAALAATPEEAFACTCLQWGNPRQELAKAEGAFIGVFLGRRPTGVRGARRGALPIPRRAAPEGLVRPDDRGRERREQRGMRSRGRQAPARRTAPAARGRAVALEPLRAANRAVLPRHSVADARRLLGKRPSGEGGSRGLRVAAAPARRASPGRRRAGRRGAGARGRPGRRGRPRARRGARPQRRAAALRANRSRPCRRRAASPRGSLSGRRARRGRSRARCRSARRSRRARRVAAAPRPATVALSRPGSTSSGAPTTVRSRSTTQHSRRTTCCVRVADDGTVEVEDDGSRNGTLVDGVSLEPRRAAPDSRRATSSRRAARCSSSPRRRGPAAATPPRAGRLRPVQPAAARPSAARAGDPPVPRAAGGPAPLAPADGRVARFHSCSASRST